MQEPDDVGPLQPSRAMEAGPAAQKRVRPGGLERFLWAQEGVYPQALEELRAGYKRSHWMWFVFPQVADLGRSGTAQQYSIQSLEEARAYAAHPELGARIHDCCAELLTHSGRPPQSILGDIDALKLRSSMTLFDAVSGQPCIREVPGTFYEGQPAPLDILQGWGISLSGADLPAACLHQSSE